uniref:Uncharacterized protein n=1 Tax=Anguilla anguilla TaxID=7936 RepID=A0A0E9TV39_ANGAN
MGNVYFFFLGFLVFSLATCSLHILAHFQSLVLNVYLILPPYMSHR